MLQNLLRMFYSILLEDGNYFADKKQIFPRNILHIICVIQIFCLIIYFQLPMVVYRVDRDGFYKSHINI